MDIVPQKTCTKCRQTKPVSAFTFVPKRNNYYSQCKACKAAARAEWRRLHPVEKKPRKKHTLPPPNPYCTVCGILKTPENTSRSSKVRSGLRSRCKACIGPDNAAHMRQRRQDSPEAMRERHRQDQARLRREKPEHHREIVRQWNERNPDKIKRYRTEGYRKNKALYIAANNRRRARLLQTVGSYSVEEWEALKTQYGNRCLSCGRLESDIDLTVDHVIPISKGGSNYISNLQPLCKSCNSKKKDKTIDYRT